MASALQNLSSYDTEKVPNGNGKSFGIAVAEWNKHITFELLKGCVETLTQHGVSENDIHIHFVPGTFELPFAGKKLAQLQNLNIAFDIPFIFGVLTPNNEEQAIDRAGGKHGNKGVEAAVTALKMSAI